MTRKKSHARRAIEPVPAPLIDSHCHLVPQVYGGDTTAVVARAFAANLACVINIGAGDGMAGNREVLRMWETDHRLHPVVGLHPHDAHLADTNPELLNELGELARRPEVVGFGEIGLDYHYDLSPRPVQRAVLQAQLAIALEVEKPIVIHVREANDDLLEIMDRAGAWAHPVVIHCFSSDWPFARQCLDRGATLGISGIVTFKNALEVKEVAARAPVERLILETDSPYLAPVPFRGQRNEPAHVHAVAREVATLKEIDPAALAAVTTRNVQNLFAIGA